MQMATAHFTVENRVGRVLEARVFSLWAPADADAYAERLSLLARTFADGGPRPILIADHRPVKVYPAHVADRLVELFTSMNLRLERAALLVTPNNVPLTLQLNRLVEAADNTKRRLFSDMEAALTHAVRDLTAQEQSRAAAFVAELDAAT